MDAIINDQSKNQGSSEAEKMNRDFFSRNKRKKSTSKTSSKNPVLWINPPEKVEQQSWAP